MNTDTIRYISVLYTHIPHTKVIEALRYSLYPLVSTTASTPHFIAVAGHQLLLLETYSQPK